MLKLILRVKTESTFVARSTMNQPRRPPPLHPKSLFLFDDRSSLPHLDDHTDGLASGLPSTARTISSFAATANVQSKWSAQYSIAEEGNEESARNDSIIALYIEQSHWSSDSEPDDEDESPLSPTFLEAWNQRRKGPDMATRPSSPFIDPFLLLDNVRPPIPERRSSITLSALSPLSSPEQSKIILADRLRKRKPLRPIGLQALPQSKHNPDGSWELIDGYGKTYNIPAISSPPSEPYLFTPSKVSNTKSENRVSKAHGLGREAAEDVRTQFRQWQGFIPKAA